MENNILLEYQRTLVIASLDGVSGVGVIPRWCGGQDGKMRSQWKLAVAKFIFRNYAAGLIFFENPDLYHINDAAGLYEAYKTIEIDGDNNSLLLWYGVRFLSTKKLDGILERFELNKWEYLDIGLNKIFISELFLEYKLIDQDISDIEIF